VAPNTGGGDSVSYFGLKMRNAEKTNLMILRGCFEKLKIYMESSKDGEDGLIPLVVRNLKTG
jgi:hypothetical protein